jgi:hypothetical protein
MYTRMPSATPLSSSFVAYDTGERSVFVSGRVGSHLMVLPGQNGQTTRTLIQAIMETVHRVNVETGASG